jgi:hypothetical protein
MSSLITDSKVLQPYVPKLMPMLQSVLSDPSPQVRASAAKAIGTLATAVESKSTNILPWLLQHIKKDSNIAERSGAAQALAELISVKNKIDDLLPTLLAGTENPKPHVRHGYLQVFVYLPAVLKLKFEPYLEECLPKILARFADDDGIISKKLF